MTIHRSARTLFLASIPPIANNPALGGAVVATQGVRPDTTPSGPQVLLLDAQDLVLGL